MSCIKHCEVCKTWHGETFCPKCSLMDKFTYTATNKATEDRKENPMTYKLIQELELKTYETRGLNGTEIIQYVLCSDLEAFLANGLRVTSFGGQNRWFKEMDDGYQEEVQALLINIREIPKFEPVTKEEILALLNRYDLNNTVSDLIKRIEKAGIA